MDRYRVEHVLDDRIVATNVLSALEVERAFGKAGLYAAIISRSPGEQFVFTRLPSDATPDAQHAPLWGGEDESEE